MKFVQIIILFVIQIICFTTSYAQELNLLIGTSAQREKTGGFYVYQFNTSNGQATLKSKTNDISDPLSVVMSNNQEYLYAVHNEKGKGTISALKFDKKTGMLNLLNQKPTVGNDPVVVTIDKQNKHVLVANYNGGTWSAFPILKNGTIENHIQSMRYSFVDTGKRGQVHVHSANLSPDERFVFISDLSNDRIISYPYSAKKSLPIDTTKPNFTQLKKGNGPRLFVFHPNKKFAYSIQEISAEIIAFQYKKGTISPIQNISTLESGYTGRKWPSEIHISPDGKFLYAANRDPVNDIAIFAIQSDGTLIAIGRQPIGSKTPRSFAIDPQGNYLLVANQGSHNITIFKRDKNTGLLTDTKHMIELNSPVFISF